MKKIDLALENNFSGEDEISFTQLDGFTQKKSQTIELRQMKTTPLPFAEGVIDNVNKNDFSPQMNIKRSINFQNYKEKPVISNTPIFSKPTTKNSKVSKEINSSQISSAVQNSQNVFKNKKYRICLENRKRLPSFIRELSLITIPYMNGKNYFYLEFMIRPSKKHKTHWKDIKGYKISITYRFVKKPPVPQNKNFSTAKKTTQNRRSLDFYHWSQLKSLKKSTKSKNAKPPVLQNFSRENINIFSFEVFATSDKDLLPNPESNSIQFIAFEASTQNLRIRGSNCPSQESFCNGLLLSCDNDEFEFQKYQRRILNVSDSLGSHKFDEIAIFKNERALIVFFINLIFRTDPDIIQGWDLDKGSLFYLAFRAKRYSWDFMNLISRKPRSLDFFTKFSFIREEIVLESFKNNILEHLAETLFTPSTSTSHKEITHSKGRNLKLGQFNAKRFSPGREFINLWNIARKEFKLSSYDLHNVYYELFSQRKPVYKLSYLQEKYFCGLFSEKAFVTVS